jgi:hypothetical protein
VIVKKLRRMDGKKEKEGYKEDKRRHRKKLLGEIARSDWER